MSESWVSHRDHVVIKVPRERVKVVQHLLPVYSRYFDLLGVVLGDAGGDLIRVQVYGVAQGFQGWALRRRGV